MICRCLPPYGYGICTPGTVTSCGRRKLTARSNSCCSGSVSLPSDSCRIGHVGRVVLDDQRRLRAGGHLADGGLRDGRHLGVGVLDLGVRLEVDLDDADAVERLALDVLDVVDGGRQDALVGRDDPLFHVLRRHARVVERDGDDRDVDHREDVGRHLRRGSCRSPGSPRASPRRRTYRAGEGPGERSTYEPLSRKIRKETRRRHAATPGDASQATTFAPPPRRAAAGRCAAVGPPSGRPSEPNTLFNTRIASRT